MRSALRAASGARAGSRCSARSRGTARSAARAADRASARCPRPSDRSRSACDRAALAARCSLRAFASTASRSSRAARVCFALDHAHLHAVVVQHFGVQAGAFGRHAVAVVGLAVAILAAKERFARRRGSAQRLQRLYASAARTIVVAIVRIRRMLARGPAVPRLLCRRNPGGQIFTRVRGLQATPYSLRYRRVAASCVALPDRSRYSIRSASLRMLVTGRRNVCSTS